jgi:hypothetical protein
MTTNKKPAPEANREAGYSTAFNSPNDSPFALRCKALLIGIAAFDAALLALPALIVWRALP